MKLNENLQFHKPETKETLGRFLSVPLFSVSALLRFKQFILLQLSSPPRLCSNKGLQATDAIGGRKAAFAGGPRREQKGGAEACEGGSASAGPSEGCHHLGRTLQHCRETQKVLLLPFCCSFHKTTTRKGEYLTGFMSCTHSSLLIIISL